MASCFRFTGAVWLPSASSRLIMRSMTCMEDFASLAATVSEEGSGRARILYDESWRAQPSGDGKSDNAVGRGSMVLWLNYPAMPRHDLRGSSRARSAPADATATGPRNYMTPNGYAALKSELTALLDVERPDLVKVVSWAA